MFRAFADPMRLRILHLVLDSELCVCDLVEALEVPQPTVSRHSHICGGRVWWSPGQSGRGNYYWLAAARAVFHERLLGCLEACFGEIPELSADAGRARRLRDRRGRCD